MERLNKKECFLSLLQLLATKGETSKAVLNKITTVLNYSCITLETSRAHGLYSLRRDVVERKEEVKAQFDNVLHCLSNYPGEEIRLHIVILGKVGILIFTGINDECELGHIMLESDREEP
ncbi:hypothetical protein HHL17_09935 [Chitinophaga sp. G-6-1-13]|uniref:Uncharacterized protein n=1 Tax=Chitinophaga fulva TaxID=2728842 RepID=A0A848GJD7_9BACT|nr:hypothetical protein [Chitinophaga fulva]NML37509.1 hypothetical protein [Chitinophaga fulva]